MFTDITKSAQRSLTMLAVLVNNVLAIPSSHKSTRLHSEHLLWESLWQSHPVAAATDSLILSNTGPCTVNRETNCVCSGNFNHDECDNTLTTATVAKGFYTNYEDCDLEWSETVELAVPYFQIESGYDVLTVDHHCSNKAMDTAYYSGDGTGLDELKVCSMHSWRTDVSVFGGGFKVCGISLDGSWREAAQGGRHCSPGPAALLLRQQRRRHPTRRPRPRRK